MKGMNQMFLLGTLMAMIQFSDSYLRYLAFSSQISKEQSRQFFYRSCILTGILILTYFFIFNSFGITAGVYKAILIFFWIPHMLVLITTIRRPKNPHIFVFGMVSIWSILQHNWAAIIDSSIFEKLSTSNILLVHSTLYLTLFILMFPVERKIFKEILPESQLLESRPLGLYISILPVVMMTGHLFLWADNQLFHSWTERLSRLYLLLAFFLIHKYVSIGSKLFYENQKTFLRVRLVEDQVASLDYHNTLMQDAARQIDNMRQNLRDDFLKIYQMIVNDEIDAAQKYIKQQTEKLHATKIISFCRAQLINASVSIYFEQAQHFDIKFSYEINLPPLNPDLEKDLAILLSNLLENAINVSKYQPKNRRNISVTMKITAEKSMFEISNHYDGILTLGADGLPINHGIGMTSLLAFVKKYGAHFEFLQINDSVHVLLYKEGNYA